ncbi:hypothetical protein ACFE04_021342 [Oxalis oulophora]
MNNITYFTAVVGCQAIANIVKSSLGPVGLEKMNKKMVGVVCIFGKGTVYILQELEFSEPLNVYFDEKQGSRLLSVFVKASQLAIFRLFNDGQYLRPSDPAYEQVLDSLAMVARHTLVPLLEALLRWRESESPKGANDATTFQRKLAVECIFCSACIRFVECCSQEGLTDSNLCFFAAKKLWSGLENFVFDWLINAESVESQEVLDAVISARVLQLIKVADSGLHNQDKKRTLQFWY